MMKEENHKFEKPPPPFSALGEINWKEKLQNRVMVMKRTSEMIETESLQMAAKKHQHKNLLYKVQDNRK